MPTFWLHDLRHSFAPMLTNEGGSFYEVQKLFVHTCLAMRQRYTHLAKDTLKEVVYVAGDEMMVEMSE